MKKIFKPMVELVGILNITPDSFSDGGLYNTKIEQFLRSNN